MILVLNAYNLPMVIDDIKLLILCGCGYCVEYFCES